MKNLDLIYGIIDAVVNEYQAMLDDDPAGDEYTARRNTLEAEANRRFEIGADTGLTDSLAMTCIREEVMGIDTGINIDREAERLAGYMS